MSLHQSDSAGASAGVVGSTALVDDASASAVSSTEAVVLGDAPARTQWQLFRRRFFRHKLAVLGLAVLLLFGLCAVFAEQIAPYELTPTLNAETLSEARQGPSATHWFGTDELGRDQLTRVIYAARISLRIAVLVAIISTAIGVAIGSVAGYFGGWIDQLLMRFTDLFLVVPGLSVLMIAQKGLQGKDLIGGFRLSNSNLIIAILSVLFWQYIARVVRGMMLSIKEKEYVEAARASGARSGRIILRHVLPNCVGPIVVNTTLVVGQAILIESTLSFLGFGVQPPEISWGVMVEQSRGAVGTDTAYLVYSPGLAILLTVLAVNYLGDGLRDAFDPQSTR